MNIPILACVRFQSADGNPIFGVVTEKENKRAGVVILGQVTSTTVALDELTFVDESSRVTGEHSCTGF